MLKNDEIFWTPGEQLNAAALAWGGSEGDFAALWEHSQERWRYMLRLVERAGAPPPSGNIVEFGSGVGHLDDLADEGCTAITMLDHTDAYLAQRARPLTARCRHVLWSPENLAALQTEPATYDWLISTAVFYHVDDGTALALIRALGTLLKPGGRVLIEGWNTASAEFWREVADDERLFSAYPRYALNLDLMQETLAPEYEELWREDILLYQKQPSP